MRSLMRFWFFCLVVITPFVFTAINDELFEFNKMMVVYALTIAVASTWAMWSIRAKHLIWRNHFLLPFMGAFLVSQVLSTIFSIHPATSIIGYYSRFHGGLLSTLAYLTLMQAAASTLSRQDVRPFLRTALLSMIGVSLYAIPEHFGISPSCLIITNEANASCWVQDVQNRVFASFGQPNWLAAYIVSLLPFAVWLILDPEKNERQDNPVWLQKIHALTPWVSIVLGMMTLIFTKSRSGALSLISMGGVVLAVTGLLGLAWVLRRKLPTPYQDLLADSTVPKRTIGALITLLLLPVLLFGFWSWSGLEGLYKSTVQDAPAAAATETQPVVGTQLESGGTDSGKIRLIVWKGALKIWKRYPLLGSGVETFAYAYYQDRPREHNDISEWDFLYNKAHNEFLNFLATTGALGLITYSGLLVGPGVMYTLDVIRKRAPLTASLAWVSSSVGLAVSNFFGFSTVMVGLLFFLLPALWIVLWRSDDRIHMDAKLDEWEKLSWQQWLAIGAVCAAALWGGTKVIQTWNNDILLARSKVALNAGESEIAYQSAIQLTSQAPTEALFWEQRAIIMSRLAMSLASQDATIAGQLATDADQSSQVMLQLNPRHINLWKSRVRVLLFLSAIDEQYLHEVPPTIKEVMQLAPTDAKLAYNLALVYESLEDPQQAEQWYKKTFELRPSYEDARFTYAAFLRQQGKLSEARDEYQYIFDHNANAINALQAVEEIEASLSAQLKKR